VGIQFLFLEKRPDRLKGKASIEGSRVIFERLVMVAHLEVKPIIHSAFRRPVDRALNLIGIDVVSGHATARQRGEVV
jgi:hypothetical protein